MSKLLSTSVASMLMLAVLVEPTYGQRPAPVDEPGTLHFRGQFDGATGDLWIGPVRNGMSRIRINAGGQSCGAAISGVAAVQGDTLHLSAGDTGKPCDLTIVRSPRGVTVQENSCMYYHGASCDFDTTAPLRRAP